MHEPLRKVDFIGFLFLLRLRERHLIALASYGGENMKNFTEFLVAVDDLVWGIPLIVLIMGTGIYLTARLGVLQFRKLGKALKYMVKNEEDGIGEVSSFGALCTAMAATIGTGNIVGVATAVVAGGPAMSLS